MGEGLLTLKMKIVVAALLFASCLGNLFTVSDVFDTLEATISGLEKGLIKTGNDTCTA